MSNVCLVSIILMLCGSGFSIFPGALDHYSIFNKAPTHMSLINTLRRIFLCQNCHLPHQVRGSVVIFTAVQKLQHLLNDDCDILGVSDPKEQLQRLQNEEP